MDLVALRTEHEQTVAAGKAILDEFKDKELSTEKKAELDKLYGRLGEIKAQIEEGVALETKRRDFDAAADWMERPQYKVPRGVGNGQGDTKAAFLGAGWEVKAGKVFAPTSLGVMVEMYPEDLLFGPTFSDDQQVQLYRKQVTVSFQPEYRAAYLKWLQLAAKFRDAAIAITMLSPTEQKALTEGIDTAGGYLVPPDVQAELMARLPQVAVMRPVSRVITTSRDRIEWTRLQKNATAGDDSIFTSGFVGDWAGETPAFASTDPALGKFALDIKKIRVASRLSNDLIADSVFNLLAFLAQDGSVNMALVEDKGFIAGTGLALQPVGLQNASPAPATTAVDGSTATQISNTSTNLGSATKLMNLEADLPPQYASRASWLGHRKTWNKVRQLVDGQNRFIWAAGFSEVGNEFIGRPILKSDFVQQDGTASNKVLYYGDFSAYIIGQRAQITTTILRERFGDTDETALILWERVGGALWNEDALRVGTV